MFKPFRAMTINNVKTIVNESTMESLELDKHTEVLVLGITVSAEADFMCCVVLQGEHKGRLFPAEASDLILSDTHISRLEAVHGY